VALLLAAPLSVRADHFNVYDDPVPLGPFSLKDTQGKTWTKGDLRGKYWIVHFFYCTCQEGCATTTRQMARLQDAFADRNDVGLLSIHVNPDEEDAEMLRSYAKDWKADSERWIFLTGEPKVVADAVRGFSMSLLRFPEKDAGHRVMHEWRLLVVDPEGRIMGSIPDAKDEKAVDELAAKLRSMLPRSILPSINAGLNAMCTVLLVVGYLAIRRRQETFHKVCMLSALAVSVVFLASYLYYHFVILDGKVTRFPDSWLRPIYLGVLLSHTVLAALVAPMALVTVYLGVRDRRVAHRRLARWTFPIWLYVSITGVVVYAMLYHLYPAL
jgi:protein SCO1/2/putative membrane protein